MRRRFSLLLFPCLASCGQDAPTPPVVIHRVLLELDGVLLDTLRTNTLRLGDAPRQLRILALDPEGELHELERARIEWLRPPTIAALDATWRLQPVARGAQPIEVIVDGQFHSYTYLLEVRSALPRFAVPPITGTYDFVGDAGVQYPLRHYRGVFTLTDTALAAPEVESGYRFVPFAGAIEVCDRERTPECAAPVSFQTGPATEHSLLARLDTLGRFSFGMGGLASATSFYVTSAQVRGDSIVGSYVHCCIGSSNHPNGTFRAARRR